MAALEDLGVGQRVVRLGRDASHLVNLARVAV
jgi:hypothetical protein